MPTAFRDRTEAGQLLARQLSTYTGRSDVIVLALPRGGVPVAYEVSRALGVPLDVFVVRKLGVPGHEELAMGAIASGGVSVLNEDVVEALRIPPRVIETVAARELRELKRRERAYRGRRAAPEVRGRTLILVDDGLATGSTMRAAVAALRGLGPPASSWPYRPRPPQPASSSATRRTTASATSRRSRSTPSACGTRISPRRPTIRSATSWRGLLTRCHPR